MPPALKSKRPYKTEKTAARSKAAVFLLLPVDRWRESRYFYKIPIEGGKIVITHDRGDFREGKLRGVCQQRGLGNALLGDVSLERHASHLREEQGKGGAGHGKTMTQVFRCQRQVIEAVDITDACFKRICVASGCLQCLRLLGRGGIGLRHDIEGRCNETGSRGLFRWVICFAFPDQTFHNCIHSEPLLRIEGNAASKRSVLSFVRQLQRGQKTGEI